MPKGYFNKKHQKTILVAPLNWGLGHATRCIPVIDELLEKDVKVLIASDGRALRLLQAEYPSLSFFSLPSYNIRYHTSSMVFNMGLQLPGILYAIYKEKKRIKQLVDDCRVDAIISDNRFGCIDKRVRTVFMTHQLNIKVPFGPAEQLVQRQNKKIISCFDECWVPDAESLPNLSGSLSHDTELNNLYYIGPLSRMRQYSREIKYDAIAVLSGPEPQRSILEKKIISQAKILPHRVLIVQGKTEGGTPFFIQNNIEVVPYLTSRALNEVIMSSRIVISRSGYSTIMDLACLEKKAILVPTPGQTEQEYLADYFFREGVFYRAKQKRFDLASALASAERFSGIKRSMFVGPSLGLVVEGFLQRL